MPTYTIHAPPPKAGVTESDPERFLFVRDGFYFWAFLLAPLWLLLHRLWLVLLGLCHDHRPARRRFYWMGAPAC